MSDVLVAAGEASRTVIGRLAITGVDRMRTPNQVDDESPEFFFLERRAAR